MEKFLDRQMLGYVFLAVCAIVLLQKISVTLLYRSLKKQTDQLPSANKRWIKQLRLKFENTYRVNRGTPDVGVFVDRQVEKMRFFRVGLHRMNTFYRKAQLICILLGGASYLLGSWAGMTLRECTEFFAMGIVSAVFLQLVDNLSGNAHSMEVVRLNLTDYLSNILLPKLAEGPEGQMQEPEVQMQNQEAWMQSQGAQMQNQEAWMQSQGAQMQSQEAQMQSQGAQMQGQQAWMQGQQTESALSGDQAGTKTAARSARLAVQDCGTEGQGAWQAGNRTRPSALEEGKEGGEAAACTPPHPGRDGRDEAAAALASIPEILGKSRRKGLSREEEEQIVREVLREFLA